MANLNDILKAAQTAQQQQRQSGFTPPAQAPVQTSAPAAQPQTQATGVQSILDRARQVQQQQRQTTGVQTTVPRTVTPTLTPTPVTTPTTTQPTSRFRSVLETLGIASTQAQRAVTGVQAPIQQQTAEANRIAELLTKPKQEVPATPFKSDKPKTVDTVKSWAGRDKLVQELNQIDTNSGFITDEQQANAVEARRREIISKLEAGDDKAGNAPQKYTDFERARNIFGGATGQSLAGTVNAAGTLLDASYHAADTNEYAGWAVDPVSAQNIGYEHDENKLADRRFVEDAAKALEANADNMGGTASTDLERAKRGLGSLGQAGVDIATNIIQMGYDAALGGLAPMFIRTFGSSAQEARQKGADINQQMLYGTTKAAIEVGTEKLFDGLAGIFGKGAADDIVEGAIRKLTKNNTGRTLLRAVAGAAGEGGEEVISDLLAPLAETIINDETLQSLFFDKDGKLFKGSYSLNGSEVLYDFLIGAAIGGLGSVTSVATGQNAQKNAELREQDAVETRVNQQMDGVMDALLGRARAVQAEQRAEAQAPVVQPTETPQNTNAQETPVQAAESISPSTDESVPPSTQDSTQTAPVELNNGQSAEEAEASEEASTQTPENAEKQSAREADVSALSARLDEVTDAMDKMEAEAAEKYGIDLNDPDQRNDLLSKMPKEYSDLEEERQGIIDQLSADEQGTPTQYPAGSIEAQIQDIDNKIQNLQSMIEMGLLPSTTAKAEIIKLEHEKNSILAKQRNGGTQNDASVESNASRNEEKLGENQANDGRRGDGRTNGRNAKEVEQARKTRDRISKERESGVRRASRQLEMLGGSVVELDSEYAKKTIPKQVLRAVKKFQAEVPDCKIIACTNCPYGPAVQFTNLGVIAFDPVGVVNYALEEGISVSQIFRHEGSHYYLAESGIGIPEVHSFLMDAVRGKQNLIRALLFARDNHIDNFHHTDNPNAKINIKGGTDLDLSNGDISEKAEQWEEVISDLYAGINRAFANKNGVAFTAEFDELSKLVQDYYADYVIPTYKALNGLDVLEDATDSATESSNASKPSASTESTRNNQEQTEGTNVNTGATGSWADSLTAQEPPAENESLEREDDDMTPLNEMDQEREEERRKEQRKETEKRFGKENHKRLSDAYETFKKWADEWTNKFGTDVKDEKGDKVQDDDGNPVKESILDDFVKNVKDMLDGEMSVQSFQEYYESLKPAEGENKGTDENYFYDDVIAAYLNQFANAERTDNLTKTGADAEIARDNYLKQAEAFAGSFEARMRKLSENFDNRTEMNAEVTENAEREVGGEEGAKRKLVNWFKRIQSRPDLFFERLGGFDPKKSKILYEIANRVKTGEKKLTNVRMGARQFFYDINSNPETAKAWRDMENGTTKGNVDIMGLGKVSLNYELALLKTLETNGAIDHIAEYGAEFPNEADYYAGRNNNGWGETDHLKVKWTPEALEQMARENLQKSQMMDDLLGSKPEKITFKDIQEEKVRILKDLRKQIKSDVMSSEIGRAAYEASVDSMQYMADEINDVTLRMYGIARALQGPNYWPMMVVGRGNNAQIMNNLAFNVEASSFLQHRKGGSGALHIVPFTEAMNNYITQASNFVAFGELSSDLNMMSKEIGVGYGKNDSQKQSIQSVIKKEAGKGAADYLTKWMETINGKPRNTSKFGSKMRSHLAQSSLMLNLGVALKQTPSYFNAMGVIDPDILIKNRLLTFGALRSAKSYANNPLIQALNSKTNVLSSRRVGYNTVEMGEAIENSRSFFGKLKSKLPGWINAKDYSTVANLALACGEQVKRNNPNLDTKSDEFYQKTAELLEEAVVKTQPIYDAQFRPEYLRSDSEITRMLSMFRTQQSQNYNNLVEAWGEYQAAKNGDAETKQAAETKLKNVVTGQVVSTLAFSLLSSAARLITHRTKDYEDEDGNFNFGKLAKRVGLDFLESAASLVWFGDVASKVAIDIGSNLAAKGISAATGNKVSGTNEFFSISDNTISLINTFASSAIALAKNPTSPKAIKNAIFDGSQAAGIPTRNGYNLLNAVVMYGYDAIGKNDGNYDDMIDMWVTEGKMSDATRATRTTEAAVNFFKKGDRNKANTLLGTLDYSNSDVMSSVKKALGTAYVDGDLSEDEYRRVLKNYVVPTTGDKIDDIIHAKDVDKAVAEYTETDPRKYNALIKAIDAAKKKTDSESKSDAVARLIIDSAMEKNGRDAFMEKYTTSSYWTAYKAAEKQTGSSNRAVEALLGIDKNKDDTFSQDELYKFYLDNPKNFHLVQAIWDANDWSTSWNDYYQSKAKRLDYDRMANQKESVTTFTEAEAKLKELQTGARIPLQKTDADREMFDIILDLDVNDEETDTIVNRYLSSGNRNNYNTLRGAGQSPEKSVEILKGIDTDEKGTISQKEMWAYYKAHPEDEAAIEALFNAQGYTGKTTKNWATFKKAKH